ncbi:MAG: protein kinase [Thermoleophilaceae bacterium]
MRPQTISTMRVADAGIPPAGDGGERLLLGRYRLGSRLGSGGFGVVWAAWDERLEREVAVKVLAREGTDGRAEREARAAARLGHPGIVGLYELAAEGEDVFLVSELVHGRTLAELEQTGELSDRDVARIGAALCEALEHAHARGVIHRDVKPQNVMVVTHPAAGAGFAKLTDFGVAQLAGGDALTRTGDVVGTLAYMAPEQAEGRSVTAACDVYSLALTLYEAWAGDNPVRAGGPAETARRLGRRLPSLARRRRDLPTELCAAVDEALDPRPERRPPLSDLRAELRAAEPELEDEDGLAPARPLEWPSLRLPRGLRAPAGIGRLAAGAAAGALMLATLSGLAPAPPFPPLALAGAVAVAVLLVPRAGWLLALLAVCCWLASPGADRPGTALFVLAAALPVPLLLPRAGRLWSLPALAPLLGAVGLGPAFVGLAGLCATPLRRAGMAAAGFAWLASAEVMTGRGLLFGIPDGALPRFDWEHGVRAAGSDAVYPLLSSPLLLPLLLWACFAAALPLVVRGRRLVFDVAGGLLWAAGLAAAHGVLTEFLASATARGEARGAVLGPLAGAAAAVAAAHARRGPARGLPEPGAAGPPRGTTLPAR